MAEIDIPAEIVSVALGPKVTVIDVDDGPLELWNAQYPRLAGWCAAVLGDEDLASDIAMEAFVRVLSRWRRLEEPRPYLYATAMNLMRDHWRATAREAGLVKRLRDDGVEDRARVRDHWLVDLTHRLPERLRGPVLLFYGADLSVEEVASALHRPIGTVKRQLADARARLLVMLEEENR